MNISAPCFEGEERSGDRIQCKFGESVITEGYYEQNPMMARCPVPMMSSVGRINVGVSNDGGSNFRYSTHLTVGTLVSGILVEWYSTNNKFSTNVLAADICVMYQNCHLSHACLHPNLFPSCPLGQLQRDV